jgi:hypothetical protein
LVGDSHYLWLILKCIEFNLGGTELLSQLYLLPWILSALQNYEAFGMSAITGYRLTSNQSQLNSNIIFIPKSAKTFH